MHLRCQTYAHDRTAQHRHRHLTPIVVFVGQFGDDRQQQQGTHPRNGTDQTHLQTHFHAHQIGQFTWQIKQHAIHTHLNREVNRHKTPHGCIFESCCHGFAIMTMAVFGCIFGKFVGQSLFFFIAQPFGLFRPAYQPEEGKHTHNHRQHALHQKHPLPVFQAHHWRHVQQPACKRATQHQGDWHTQVIPTIGLAAKAVGKPIRQVQHHAR